MVSPSSAGAWGGGLPVTARNFRDQHVRLALRRLGVAASRVNQPRGHALLVVEQRLERIAGAIRW